MRGMDEEASKDPEALNNKSIPARLLVMAGGSIMNLLLAFVLFFVVLMIQDVRTGEVYIREVFENTPASKAGLTAEDTITHINGVSIKELNDVVKTIRKSKGEAVDIRVNRGGETHDFLITPEKVGRNAYRIGFGHNLRIEGNRSTKIHEGIYGSAEMITLYTRETVKILVQLFTNPRSVLDKIGGPIRMGGDYVDFSRQSEGFFDWILRTVLYMAFISTALGMMNLLPIPALDGARIIFLLIEAVRRKPIPIEKEAMVHFVGIVALLLLAVFIAYRDILYLIPGLNDSAG